MSLLSANLKAFMAIVRQGTVHGAAGELHLVDVPRRTFRGGTVGRHAQALAIELHLVEGVGTAQPDRGSAMVAVPVSHVHRTRPARSPDREAAPGFTAICGVPKACTPCASGEGFWRSSGAHVLPLSC